MSVMGESMFQRSIMAVTQTQNKVIVIYEENDKEEEKTNLVVMKKTRDFK